MVLGMGRHSCLEDQTRPGMFPHSVKYCIPHSVKYCAKVSYCLQECVMFPKCGKSYYSGK